MIALCKRKLSKFVSYISMTFPIDFKEASLPPCKYHIHHAQAHSLQMELKLRNHEISVFHSTFGQHSLHKDTNLLFNYIRLLFIHRIFIGAFHVHMQSPNKLVHILCRHCAFGGPPLQLTFRLTNHSFICIRDLNVLLMGR